MKNISLYQLANKIFKIPRSLAGEGNRKTLNILSKFTKNRIKIKGFKTNTYFNGWKIPKEWKVIHAYVKNKSGKKIVDFKKNNLHLVSYSDSFKGKLNLQDFKKRVFTLKHLPRAIPYVTSYYSKNYWGICMNYNNYKRLKNEVYEINIKTEKINGVMNFGEYFVKGKTKKEIILMSYICHPQMANNELSGPVVLSSLINKLKNKYKKTNFSYRFLFLPETIGSIAYLNKNYKRLKDNFFAGYVLTCIGTLEKFKLIPSLTSDSISNKIAIQELQGKFKTNWKKMSYLDRGSDERQWCFPGTNLQISSIVTSKYNDYKEYHTSLDNMSFINKLGLIRSRDLYLNIIKNYESSSFFKIKSLGEPKLDKYGIYPKISTSKTRSKVKDLMNVLTYCDGTNNIKEISKLSKLSYKKTNDIASLLHKLKIIKKI